MSEIDKDRKLVATCRQESDLHHTMINMPGMDKQGTFYVYFEPDPEPEYSYEQRMLIFAVECAEYGQYAATGFWETWCPSDREWQKACLSEVVDNDEKLRRSPDAPPVPEIMDNHRFATIDDDGYETVIGPGILIKTGRE